MPTADTLSEALARLANDQRRTAPQYANIQARPGNANTPRRLISDVGFLQARQFAYVAAHQANYLYNNTESPREIRQVVLVPYGLSDDYARITSTRPQDRLVHAVTGSPSGGMSVAPFGSGILMSGGLNNLTYSGPKTANVIRRMTTTAGPAYHFVVNRRGDISVGPGVDARTTAIPDFADLAVFIAVESALVISRQDHEDRRFDRIVELPLTGDQLITLAVLVNKLLVVLGSQFPRQFSETLTNSGTGFTYRTAEPVTGVTLRNFQAVPAPGFDYTLSSAPGFFNLVARQGSFDLATQVWRPLAGPTPVVGREEVRGALSTIDTAGAESVYLGAYATLAAGERSNEMQAVPRTQLFAQRQRVSYRDGRTAAEQSSNVAETGNVAVLPSEVPANYEPHTYDFVTGLWGDRKPY
jgi:hypothetical protein